MSLSDSGLGGAFGNQQDKPVSKVYTKLNIIDGYQERRGAGQHNENEEEKESAQRPGLLDDFAPGKLPSLGQDQVLSPITPFNSFTVKAIEFGRSNTKFDLAYKSHVWIISKN